MINKFENLGGSSLLFHVDAKTIAANKSHSEAERRRRKRINAHLATLRTLIPKTIKGDKASLLAEVVQYLRQLQEEKSKLASHLDGSGSEMNISLVFPTETDEFELFYCDESEVIVQVTLCYEERPEIMMGLTRAIKSIQGKVVRAEMATMGGRSKNVLWVQLSVGGDEGLVRLKRALKVVLSKTDFVNASGMVLPGNKRPLLYHS